MRQDNVLVFQSLEGAARFLASVSVFLSWNEDCCQLQVTFVGDIVQLKHGKSQIWMRNGTEIELFAQQWSSGTWNPNGWNPFCSRGFCDVKFQNWLFATPISGPPRSGAVKRQWQVLALACLEDRPREFGLLWCSSISHLGLSTPRGNLRATPYPLEERAVPYWRPGGKAAGFERLGESENSSTQVFCCKLPSLL